MKLKVSKQARKEKPSLPEYLYARGIACETHGVEKMVLTSLPADRCYGVRQQTPPTIKAGGD